MIKILRTATRSDVRRGVRNTFTGHKRGNAIASLAIAVYVLVITLTAGTPAWLGYGIVAGAVINLARLLGNTIVGTVELREFDEYLDSLAGQVKMHNGDYLTWDELFTQTVRADVENLGPDTAELAGPLPAPQQ